MKKLKAPNLKTNLTRIVTKSQSTLNLTSAAISTKTNDLPNGKSSILKTKSFGQNKKQSEKQNIPANCNSSPEDKLKDKNYKPMINKGKKNSKLQLSQNTVSLVINESSIQIRNSHHQILDSLLYGSQDLRYSQDLTCQILKHEDNEQLLIQNCDYEINHKHCRSLSPIKSISQYSVSRNQNNILAVERIQQNYANVLLKLRKPEKQYKNKNKNQTNILYQRLIVFFNQKSEKIINFYMAIHNTLSKSELQQKIREFLFKNSIIFNKNELNQFIQQIQAILRELQDKNHSNNYFCQANYEHMIQTLFFTVKEYNQIQKIWLNQDVLDGVFLESSFVSLWNLIIHLTTESNHHTESTFTQSRFCIPVDKSPSLHEADEKKKREGFSAISQWISKFIKNMNEINSKKQSEQNEMKIKISPPVLR